jgi:hypothetical protein
MGNDYYDVYDNQAMRANANYQHMMAKNYKSHESFNEPDYEDNPCDMVNHPSHYTVGGIETIDVIEAKLDQSEFQGYCLGNILKYLMRAGYKGKQLEDLRKAQFYLNRMIDSYEDFK